jgi:uncharacterized protein (TIGR00369 family)
VLGDVPFDDGNCFACGPANPIGMHLHFDRDQDGTVARAHVTLAEHYQGWRGIAHGGIVMALLDEAMAHAAGYAGYRGVTANVEVRFRKPVPLGKPIEARGWVSWRRRNVLGVEAQIVEPGGGVLAHAKGSFVSLGALRAADDRLRDLIDS